MPLPQATIDQLQSSMTVDFTTIGRNSGEPRTIEIWWFHIEDRFIITGTPGPRDWLANVRANPAIVITAASGKFDGTAVEIDDHDFRRTVFTDPRIGWHQTQEQLEVLIESAPMIEVRLNSRPTN
jgi:deazaflavin-dependent oxidoreductase (nitroreductase family)